MNNDQIENMLRKAPAPNAPKGLLDDLTSDIRLPRSRGAFGSSPTWWSLFKQWIPATACLALGIVVVGAQQSALSTLKQQNAELRQSVVDVEALRQQNAEYRRLAGLSSEIARLTQDRAEVDALRTEIASLKGQLREIELMKAENEKILAELRLPAGTVPQVSDLADAKAKAQRIKCVNNLKNIGLAFRIYAVDHSDVLPPDFLSVRNELSTPKLLVCPADEGRVASENWQQFTMANCSYDFLAANAPQNEPSRVSARCPIHNNVCLIDGSVQQLGPQRAIVERDGKFYMSEQ